jgi:hypothetical protein
LRTAVEQSAGEDGIAVRLTDNMLNTKDN